jgi:hypothetical protein
MTPIPHRSERLLSNQVCFRLSSPGRSDGGCHTTTPERLYSGDAPDFQSLCVLFSVPITLSLMRVEIDLRRTLN